MNVRVLSGSALCCLFISAFATLPAVAAPVSVPHVALQDARLFGVSQNLYVSNQTTNAITVYPAEAKGNVAPRRIIAGPNTHLTLPSALAVDFVGDLYVANGANILEFGPEARGNVEPKRMLSLPFPRAAFRVVTAITADFDGTLYAGFVAAPAGGQLTGYLLRYAPHATAASAVLVEGGVAATALTLDSTDTRVLSAINATSSCAATGVDAIAKTFTASSQAKNLISDPNLCTIRSIADDRETQSYVLTSTNANGYFRYAENTVTPPLQHPAPLAHVTSGAPGGFLALDLHRNVYDATAFGSSIAVFAPSADGAAAPVRVLAGPATQLDSIGGIAIGGFTFLGRIF